MSKILSKIALPSGDNPMDYPKLARQPLSVVLAEFRFSPVLAIQEKIPHIQERLRHLFPRFEQRQVTHLAFSAGESPKVTQELVPSWLMRSEDNRRAAIIE